MGHIPNCYLNLVDYQHLTHCKQCLNINFITLLPNDLFIRRILKILEISLPYENSFNQYNNPYSHIAMFIKMCIEYGVSNNLEKWRNERYFLTSQSRAWETGRDGMSYINENSFSRCIIEKSDGLTKVGLHLKYLKQSEIMHI